MDMLQAIGVAILQGATELFPVSSLGHAVVIPALFRLSLDENAPEFLPFLVLLHVGTAVAYSPFSHELGWRLSGVFSAWAPKMKPGRVGGCLVSSLWPPSRLSSSAAYWSTS